MDTPAMEPDLIGQEKADIGFLEAVDEPPRNGA